MPRRAGAAGEQPAIEQVVCDAVVAAMRASLRDGGRARETTARLDSVLRTGPVEF